MSKPAIRNDWVGQIIDEKFTLLQWLGSAEWSDVFLTELPENRQKAAIKLLPADTADAAARMAGWVIAATLSHPHLIRLFHAGRCQIKDAHLLFAVMEYAEEDLSQIIPDRPLTPSEAREMLDPVVDALSYLHQKGFVHGHLKPSNVMVVDNQLKLSCDGLHATGERVDLLAPTIYDAPEVATEKFSPAADIWSLGVTLVEALTQHPPVWDRSTRSEPALPEPIPQPFADIAQECLRSDPVRRCTISDIKARLEPARSLPAPPSETDTTLPSKLRVTVIIATGLILLTVLTVLKLRSPLPRPSVPIQEQQASIAALPPQSAANETQSSKGATEKGAVVGRVQPEVPRNASKTIQGTVKVRIRVTVDSSGNVSNTTFDSPGPSKYFANQAMQAARQWKFKPAEVDGHAVSSVWILQFQFGQTGTEITPVEIAP